MRFLLKVVFYLLLLLLVATGGAAFFFDALVKRGVEAIGSQVTGVEVRLEGVNLSLLSGKGEIRGLTVANPKGYRAPHALKLERAFIHMKPLTAFSDRVVIHGVAIRGPDIHYEKRGGRTNLEVIQANVESFRPADKKTEAGRKLQIDSLVVRDARVHWYGDKPDAPPTVLTLNEIHLKNLGQGPEGITGAELTRKLSAAVIRDTASAVGRKIAEGVGRATQKLKGLFGK